MCRSTSASESLDGQEIGVSHVRLALDHSQRRLEGGMRFASGWLFVGRSVGPMRQISTRGSVAR